MDESLLSQHLSTVALCLPRACLGKCSVVLVAIGAKMHFCCLPVTIGRALALYACRDGPIHRGKLLLDGAAAEHEDERDGSVGKPCTAATLFRNGLLWGEFPLYSVSLISLVLLSRACHGK